MVTKKGNKVTQYMNRIFKNPNVMEVTTMKQLIWVGIVLRQINFVRYAKPQGERPFGHP